ncbi:low molecular weight phosphotyrosine protein phosphatase [Pseudenhygromyxa sp. WMMC2535]|uniref:low molecular weight protein-tyrosine-phosphatase n=1 Tax=Pseudenhygromyxa sp. WMMC2535 TaxID=2712867 RepID=UPI0015521C4D|nr:low molecular weight protein-tyrosine-phosphatase [Pseudenhygromyxa sp. WMMC2535]NVB42247.1 low molecular weight phosphotyrosine protein phosphatase [Pseudenhygromyxa sp. WMMC2535]
MASEPALSVCFVCLGNICRSPTAEGVFIHLVEAAGLSGRVRIDSAGTGGWHAGERADRRARLEGQRRGIALPSLAREVQPEDFADFDWLLAMDRANLRDLEAMAPAGARAKLALFRSFDPQAPEGAEVPDPYYGGDEGFAEVFDMCEAAAAGLLERLRPELER